MVDRDVFADLEAISQTEGIVRDPELYRWISERADRVRRETLEKFGVQEIGAEIIRMTNDGDLQAAVKRGG
jgi:hypothetical protein